MILANGLSPLRESVCANPRVDRAMTVCFACSSPAVAPDDVTSALASYVDSLRAETGNLLHQALDLFAIVS